MSVRRHRVKATANLANIKRKPRNTITTNTSDEIADIVAAEVLNAANTKQEVVNQLSLPKSDNTDSSNVSNFELTASSPQPDSPVPLSVEATHCVPSELHNVGTTDFKMPASANALEDVFQSDIEDNVIQMDLQKSLNGYPMSPSKVQARQRVRPTPVFGQRRNSLVCNSPSPHTANIAVGGGVITANDIDSSPQAGEFMSPGTPQRRERYFSGSSSTYAPGTPQPQTHKYFPQVMSPGMGRIRTESTCSVFSDSYSISGKQQRKNDEQRINAKRDFEIRFNNGVPDKSTFKMFDLIYYNPNTNPMEQKQSLTSIKAETTTTAGVAAADATTTSPADEAKPTKEELVEKLEANNAALAVPQLKLNANGEMIIDEKTLEIETTAEQEARKVLANSSLILMDDNTGMNGFYRRQKRTRGWSSEETVRFYRSLQIIGTDFSLMCQLFPNRTRRDLKLKYKKEERTNGALINKALLYPKAFNVQELKDQLEQEDREKEEAERQWKEIRKREASELKKEPLKADCRATRALRNGDYVYNNENVISSKLGKRALNKKRAPCTMEQETYTAAEQTPIDGTVTLQTELDTFATKPTPRRRRRVNVEAPIEEVTHTTLPPFATIKQETIIKIEQTQQQHNANVVVGQDVLEQEINALLAEDVSDGTATNYGTTSCTYIVTLEDNNKTIVNMDDGTVSTYAEQEAVHGPRPITPSIAYIPKIENYTEIGTPPVISETTSTEAEAEISEHDIQQILTELAEGSLVLVSSLDAENADREVNEIYMVDQKSGELYDKPLNIPENIVQCIMAVMS